MVKNTSITLRYNHYYLKILEEVGENHFSDDELALYDKRFPGMSLRAKCAATIRDNEEEIVKKTVEEVFQFFPFEDIDYGPDKCVRDVSMVSLYVVRSMLMNDIDWLRESLLYWMKTIVQAFNFPQMRDDALGRFAKLNIPKNMINLLEKSDKLDANKSAIFFTYTRLAQNYFSVLPQDEWQLVVEHYKAVIRELSV